MSSADGRGQLRDFAYGSDEGIDPAEDYHRASRITPATARRLAGPSGGYFATVPGAHLAVGRPSLLHAGPAVQLAEPMELPCSVRSLVATRRSRLPEVPGPVSVAQLSTVLGLGYGPRFPAKADQEASHRVGPSGGGLYPLDLFVLAADVAGLPPGCWYYDAAGHRLHPAADAEPVEFHRRASLAPGAATPAVTVALTATFARSRAKYGLRGYRFVLLEAGHVAQNMLLAATALGLASLPWGGYCDTEVDQLLRLDGVERSCVYLVSICGSDGRW
ncbi:MAG: SagB/ThcOx family dehydrogenase [Jatrophihabitans sp.]